MTDTVTISSADLIAGYFNCWNTTDPLERLRAVERVWEPDARSVDPIADATGHDALTAMFAEFHDTYAGHTFRPSGGIDTHHSLVRWGWEMVAPDGAIALNGIDCALLAENGRISYLAGFFGIDLPAPS